MPEIMTEKTEYEIIKINEEDKVVITTYEGKYLIADFNIFQDISTITIDTENYKLIDVVSDKIEKIQYKDFKDFKYIYTGKEGMKIKHLLLRDL